MKNRKNIFRLLLSSWCALLPGRRVRSRVLWCGALRQSSSFEFRVGEGEKLLIPLPSMFPS